MIGKQISNFQINAQLGSGGMGTVYKAKDLKLNRNVAIKMLHPHITNNSNAYKRFQNEAQISAQINHPNVATLYDFISHEGRSYIVMEYVNGETIESVLEAKGKFSEKESIDIVIQMLRGLGEAHRLNILHRDLKPGNIMVNKNGFTKLMDFGIARFNNSTRITAQNKVIGTAEYIAPEIYQSKEPSKVSDLYAVGVILYEMLSGKSLFQADSDATLIYKVVHGKTDFDVKAIHPQLGNIIKTLTHKNPKRRYRTAEEVIAILSKVKIENAPVLFNFGNKLKPIKDFLNQTNFKMPSFMQATWLQNTPMKFLFVSILLSGLIIGLGSFFFKSSDLKEVVKKDIPSQNIIEETTPLAERNTSSTNLTTLNSQNIEVAKPDLLPVDLESKKQPQAEQEPEKNTPSKQNSKNLEKPSNRVATPSGKPENKKEPKQASKTYTKTKEAQKNIEVNETKNLTTVEKKSDEKSAPNENLKEEIVESPKVTNIEKKEAPQKSKQVYIEQQFLKIRFNTLLSSKENRLGDLVYLKADQSLSIDGVKVVSKGAPVKAKISQLKRKNNGKVLFAVQILSVQSDFGYWLDLDYPEYSKIEKGEVIFQKGISLSKVKLKAQTTKIKY